MTTDDFDRQTLDALATFVRRVCSEKRLTYRELARRSGLRRELIGNIARGMTNPGLTNVLRLVEAMGASAEDLGTALDAARVREQDR